MRSECPPGWREATWGDIAELAYGKALEARSDAGAVTVYGTNGPTGRADRQLGEDSTVVIGRKGAYRGVHFAPGPFWVIDTAFFLVPSDAVDIRWAYYELLTHDINALDSGSAIPSTSRADFYAMPVRVPPPKEQARIASVLRALDDKIESNHRLRRVLEEVAEATFRARFVDFLDVEEFDDSALGPIPCGWPTGVLADIATVVMGQSPPGSTYSEIPESGTLLVQGMSGFGDRFPQSSTWTSAPTKLAPAGATLMTVRAPVGAVNVSLTEVCVGRGVAGIYSQHPSFTEFLVRSLKSHWASEESGTIFPAVNRKQILGVPLVIPPPAEVKAFEDFARPLTSQLLTLHREVKQLTSIRDTLLPKLISGEIRVPELAEVGRG